MRVDVLHRQLVRDISMIQPVMEPVLPSSIPQKYTTQMVNLKSFIHRLNVVSEPLQIFNEIKYDAEIEPGEYVTSGLWLGSSELPDNGSSADIRILWHVPPGTNRIQFTNARWQRRRYFWWQMVMHELIHRYQDVHRQQSQTETKNYATQTTSRSLKESRSYLGNYDEIEAHAHNAALEFLTWFPGATYRECVSQVVTYSGRKITPTYLEYSTAFADTSRHPAFLAFQRKTKAWMKMMAKSPEDYACLQLPALVG